MKKILAILLTAALSVTMFVGCSTNSGNDASSGADGSSGTSANGEVSGKILLNGSTSMEKVVGALNEVWNQNNPNAQAEGQYTGSGDGIKAVADGTADIGNSSRALKDDEKSQGLTENIIALDGIAIVTDKENTVSNLTKDQLIQIYTGEITNWSELGGADQQIVVIGRESNSGTRGAFEELLELKDKCKYAQEINSTGGILSTVQSTPGAIGYSSLADLTDDVKALSLDGVEASVENIKNGTYSMQRPFYSMQRPFVMATKGTIEEQDAQVKAYLEFVFSEEGQQIVEKCGLITVD